MFIPITTAIFLFVLYSVVQALRRQEFINEFNRIQKEKASAIEEEEFQARYVQDEYFGDVFLTKAGLKVDGYNCLSEYVTDPAGGPLWEPADVEWNAYTVCFDTWEEQYKRQPPVEAFIDHWLASNPRDTWEQVTRQAMEADREKLARQIVRDEKNSTPADRDAADAVRQAGDGYPGLNERVAELRLFTSKE